MSSLDPTSSSPELWQSLSRLADGEDSADLWQDILSCLIEQTHAVAIWLRLRSSPGMELESGTIDTPVRAWLGAWCSQAMQRKPGMESRLVGDTSILCVRWGDSEAVADGCLALCFPADREISEEDRGLILTMGRALSTTARQSNELQRTRENLNRVRHLYEVGQAIASTLDLDQVLKQSTERVTEVLHAESSTLILIDEDRRELVFKIPAGPAEHMLREQRMPIDKGVAGWVVTHGEPVIIADVASDERFYMGIDRLTGYRTQSIMAVPLQVKGKTIGVLEVINKASGASFTGDDLQWLSILAPLVAAAVENARLFTELRDEHDRIIAAEEKVRHELARNLHDGPAQIMAAMILNIDMARRHLASGPEKMSTELNFLESLAQEANQEIRDLLFNLRPLVLETHGLIAALRQLVERLQPHATFRLHLDVSRLPDDPIDLRIAGTLFVIIQEALNNIQKHSQAEDVWVRLGAGPNLWVEVADDGRGFDVKATEANYARMGSFGLLNMRERARLIDGQTEIISPRPGHKNGTMVRVEVPR